MLMLYLTLLINGYSFVRLIRSVKQFISASISICSIGRTGCLIIGSIIGVQVGQKIGQYLDSSHLKTLFAMLLCCVAIAIAYDTFFYEGSKAINQKKIELESLSSFSKFIVNLSDNSPLLYGSFAILLAIFLGIIGASLRQLLSKYQDKIVIRKKN